MAVASAEHAYSLPSLEFSVPMTVASQQTDQPIIACKLMLRDGTYLVFSEKDIPSPLAMTFTDNIPT
jgi:hypothetical protein